MKYKTTKKAVKNEYYKIISVGYCELQHLLKGVNPVAYSTRAEGWACDYYDINGVCICEGYAPISSQNTKEIPYDKVREYDNKAREVIQDLRSGGWEDIKNALNDLLREFIKEGE